MRVVQLRRLTVSEVIKSNILNRHLDLISDYPKLEPTKVFDPVFDKPIQAKVN